MASRSAGAAEVATSPLGGQAAAPDSLTGKGAPDEKAIVFDSDFLSMSGGSAKSHVDLSYFTHRGGMMPGIYQVQVKVNDRVVEDVRSITFRSWPDSPGKLYACVNPGMLAEWGVKSSGKAMKSVDGAAAGKGSQESGVKAGATDCPVGGVTALVQWSTEAFDFNKKLLQLTVPQAALGPASMMRTSPNRWDEGIPALLMNYNYNGNRQSQSGNGQNGQSGSDYLGLDGQLNLLGWRVRSGLNWQSTQGGDQSWSAQDVYVQHDYAMLRGGQFSAGRLTSDGSVVDSVQFVGMKMESDSGMLNPEFTSYRPAITGIANTPATVTVRQYGKLIYQQNVPQGPFSLADFNRNGNGDVEVEIREADGSVRRFTMSSAVTPALMTKGALGYSVSTGKYRDGNNYLSPEFVQGNLSFGLGSNTSLLAGTLLSRDYQAVSAGGGVYSGLLGAFALTGTLSLARLSALPRESGHLGGASGQFSWSRNIGEVALGFATTRYASRNYRSFSDMQQADPSDVHSSSGQRATYQITLSRSLGAFGSLSLSGNQTEYWGGQPTQRGYTLGYNTSVHDIGMSVSAGYNTYSGGGGGNSSSSFGRAEKNDKNIAVNISLPLGKWLGGGGGVRGNYMYSRYGDRATQQAGVSGSVLNGRGNYSVSQGWGDSQNRNASMGYSSKYANFNGGYSTYGENQSWSYGMSGAVLVHPHGVTLAKQLSLDGATALIEMPGIGGVRVNGVETDWRGYAVVSGVTPYDLNKMNVDVSNLPGNVELDRSSKNMVPSRGAVVRVRFSGSLGYRVLFELSRAAGGSIPFGAVVALKGATMKDSPDIQDTQHTGIVGDNGQAYLSGLPEKGTLLVSWSDGKDGRCSADYQLQPGTDVERLTQITATCR
ncbi:fimbrial biogenesis outer membrane usher protein [Rahnella aceris]|uniref:fimbria/pilus outer membrane usher protein n=1 Tax=Rahnella sp. (strain Y9602) TaxID=2703885 RepID=UPI001C253A95|nr:fimbria/pilus outer membrane usher protein [Rahnella aceris]MBU9839245.1 fimbrial biogenesis outer membrane usher protein [Rahnella aceris]